MSYSQPFFVPSFPAYILFYVKILVVSKKNIIFATIINGINAII